MKTKERVEKIMQALNEEYGTQGCALEYEKPYELLFATRLSAQCTDARVNIITKDLFAKYPTLEAFAKADLSELEDIVRPCGYFRQKAKNIIAAANVLLDQYGGEVPDTMEELLKIPGVGRKTANLILGDIFHQPAIVADTHCIRISNKLGLAKGTDPAKVEAQLRKIIPPEGSAMFCHQLVWHGRKYCIARRPQCGTCPLNLLCPSSEAK